MGAADGLERVNCLCRLLALRIRFRTNFVDQRFEYEEEGWGIGVMGVLNLELLWHFTSSFRSKDLLTANPTIIVHKIEPTSYDLETVRLSAA